MYTRQQFITNRCTFAQFYGQFVTPTIKDIVVRKFGLPKIIESYSHDEHLNNIPLKLWDEIQLPSETIEKLVESGDTFTLAGKVCILKTAARLAIP